MNTLRKRRLYFVGLLIGASIVVFFLVVLALRENMNLFYTPSQVVLGEVKPGTRFRVGGLVKPGSVVRGKDLEVQFVLSDFPKASSFTHTNANAKQALPKVAELIVKFTGILPDLFKEGQGIVTTGELGLKNTFMADEVLAKHDENYSPPEKILGNK